VKAFFAELGDWDI